jgi:hypothetical protein
MRGKLGAVVAVVLLVGLPACGGTTPTAKDANITDRLMLSATVSVAGHPIKGEFIVINPGGSFNLNHGCRPQFAVTLSNRTFPPDAAFTLPCSSKPFIIRHGANRLPFTVFTGYPSCTQPGGGPVTQTSPSCLDGNIIPPLPPGTYRAVENGGIALPAPRPVTVRLTS